MILPATVDNTRLALIPFGKSASFINGAEKGALVEGGDCKINKRVRSLKRGNRVKSLNRLKRGK